MFVIPLIDQQLLYAFSNTLPPDSEMARTAQVTMPLHTLLQAQANQPKTPKANPLSAERPLQPPPQVIFDAGEQPIQPKVTFDDRPVPPAGGNGCYQSEIAGLQDKSLPESFLHPAVVLRSPVLSDEGRHGMAYALLGGECEVIDARHGIVCSDDGDPERIHRALYQQLANRLAGLLESGDETI